MKADNLPESVHALADSDDVLFMILSTARQHGQGIRRLPDREDRGRRVVSIQVESDAQARLVLTALDRADREFYVDVERKQDLHLQAVAKECVLFGTLHDIKPNDTTIDALDAVIAHHLTDVTDKTVTVIGAGNLGFKAGLRLAERGALVNLISPDRSRRRGLTCV